jgi:hypothetical protein
MRVCFLPPSFLHLYATHMMVEPHVQGDEFIEENSLVISNVQASTTNTVEEVTNRNATPDLIVPPLDLWQGSTLASTPYTQHESPSDRAPVAQPDSTTQVDAWPTRSGPVDVSLAPQAATTPPLIGAAKITSASPS